jgi:hypothetical protein
MEGSAILIIELSMVDRKTPTATTRNTAHRFCFSKEDTENDKKEENSKQKKTSPENQSSF